MAVVSLKIGANFYKFSCGDGQEMRMRELAATLDKRAEQLIKNVGGMMNEGQLLAMMCLLLAEEKYKLEKENNMDGLEQTTARMAESLHNLAVKINDLAESLEQ